VQVSVRFRREPGNHLGVATGSNVRGNDVANEVAQDVGYPR
jgi:hypothetical protein